MLDFNTFIFGLINLPFLFLLTYLNILLFTFIFKIEKTKTQQIKYVIYGSLILFIFMLFIKMPYVKLLRIFLCPILAFSIFKADKLTSVLAPMFSTIIRTLSQSLFSYPVCKILGISIDLFESKVISYEIIISSITIIFMVILYRLVKHTNAQIDLSIIIKKDKIKFTLLFILGIVILILQYIKLDIEAPYYNQFISTMFSILYLTINVYIIYQLKVLGERDKHIETLELYNKTITVLYDNIRIFKHDFDNIIQALGGYILINDMDGLKSYYTDLLSDCQKTNNLNTLNPKVVNNAAIYSVLVHKYEKAEKEGIKVNLDIFLDLKTIKMKSYELSKILGILLDNAIEATKKCENKIINVMFYKEKNRNLCIVENTYYEKEIDIDKIFEKNFTTKQGNTGLGLWEVRKILNRYTNINLFTSKNQDFFKQQLEVYER